MKDDGPTLGALGADSGHAVGDLVDATAGDGRAEAAGAGTARAVTARAGGRSATRLSGAPTGALTGASTGVETGALTGAPTYLDRIVPAVRHRLEERKRRLPQPELAAMATPGARPSFAAALRAPGVSLIAEVKRASPSKGPIRPDLEVRTVVQAYETAGACAISVLTEQDHFGGSLDDMRAAAAHTRLPLLRKDFIVDEYQIHEARVFGASAVLLIAAVLDDRELRDLTGLAHDLDLDVLLEVHDPAEMARVLQIDGVVIGINNRDLRTFAVSLETTARLAASVPFGRLLVGESGIRDHADVERLASCGVDAVLVGESILRAPDVGAAVRALMLPTSPVADRSVGLMLGKETS